MAQVAQADTLVAGVLLHELGQHLPQGLVLVVVVLELLQRGDQRVPAALGDADGEHDEEAVQAALLDDDAVLGQVLGDDGSRNAEFVGEVAIDIEAGGDDGGLDRVQHVEAFGQVAEAVPAVAGLEHPGVALLDAFFRQVVRTPHLEPPVGAPLLVHLAHGAAEVEGFGDRLLDQRGTARLFHHRRCHVAGGDDRILR